MKFQLAMMTLLVVPVLGYSQPALSQSAGGQTIKQQPSALVKALAAEDETAARPLKAAVNLPDLPQFSGQTVFIKGEELAGNDRMEGSYTMLFKTNQRTSAVIDWYKNAFNMYGWDLQNGAVRSATAVNNKSGNICYVYCDHESASGCQVTISYTMAKQKTAAHSVY